MAIDGEKRARGLRVPSLASIKAFSKKNDSSSNLQQHQQQQQRQQERQQEEADFDKNLPSPPGFSPVSAGASASAMPAKRAPQSFGFDAVPMSDFESSRYPMPGPASGPASGPPASGPPASGPPASGPPASGPPASGPPASGPASGPSVSGFSVMSGPGPTFSSGAVGAVGAPRSYDGLAAPPVQRTPSNGSRTEDSDPLEDYIPEPSPETDEMMYQAVHEPNDAVNGNGNGTYDHPVNGNGGHDGEVNGNEVNGHDDWEPPMADVPAPLGKLHFACYQEHRSMPTSANVWHAVPCMTCYKADREVRHRCVFCCLRICEGCFGTLQKCPRRSLDELLPLVR